MWKTTLNARTSAVPAIFAALALSSTPALAQAVQPVPSDPPAVTTAPDVSAPATTPAVITPPTTDTSIVAPDASTSAAGAAPTAKAVSTTTHKRAKTIARTVAVAPAAKAAPARTATPAHTVAAAPRSTPAPVAAKPAQTSQSAVRPLVDVNSNPTPTKTASSKPAKKHDDTLPIAGGALAFLAIGGAAVAMTRRRHDDDEEWVEEPTAQEPMVAETPEAVVHEDFVHAEEPAVIAPAASAFAWGNREETAGQPSPSEAGDDIDDRLPGESWVQRAYRGPTPNNPSVSLRARLKRAAFFDKRERDVAAGKAEPVEMDAGLPEAMVSDAEERELA